MIVKVKKLRGGSRHQFNFNRHQVTLDVAVAPSGTLFFSGKLAGEAVSGFLYRTGGYMAQSDALGKREEKQFVDSVAQAAGYRTK